MIADSCIYYCAKRKAKSPADIVLCFLLPFAIFLESFNHTVMNKQGHTSSFMHLTQHLNSTPEGETHRCIVQH